MSVREYYRDLSYRDLSYRDLPYRDLSYRDLSYRRDLYPIAPVASHGHGRPWPLEAMGVHSLSLCLSPCPCLGPCPCLSPCPLPQPSPQPASQPRAQQGPSVPQVLPKCTLEQKVRPSCQYLKTIYAAPTRRSLFCAQSGKSAKSAFFRKSALFSPQIVDLTWENIRAGALGSLGGGKVHFSGKSAKCAF